ncbi:MAG: 50S ribosomal protein L30 [Eubacteriales bacterium]|nr:50S ribosomal protein L30 [Eubacteriales bacterium]
MSKLLVTLIKSTSGANKAQLANLQSLGLTKRGNQVLHEDNAAIRGICRKVSHLVSCEVIDEEA